MSSFVDRLKSALGGHDYDTSLRRSVQTAVLYEAHRCIADKMPSMRPFQRKVAFYDQAKALLEATGFQPHQQNEIMWRTGTSKEPLTPESAWKRVRLVEKELEKIRDKVKPLCEEGKSHDDIVNEFIQQQFEQVTGHRGKTYPSGWEHSHNNVILTYRMYYDGTEPDPSLPPPVPFKQVVVPVTKPKDGVEDPNYFVRVPSEASIHVPLDPATNGATSFPPAATVAEHHHDQQQHPVVESAEDRLSVLKEVRAHMELLNDFVGIIPQDQLNQRKRELFNAMPNAPPTAAERANKRLRQTNGPGVEDLSHVL